MIVGATISNVWLAMLLVLVGCADLPTPRPATPPAEADEPVAAPVRVPVHAEAQYQSLSKGDPRLDRTCDDLAYLVAHGGEATLDVVTPLLRMHGIVEPPQRVVAGTATDDLGAQLGEDRFHSNTVVGRGLYETTAVEILIFLPNIRIAALPRAASDGVDLAFELDEPLHSPQVIVADASSSEKLDPIATDHGFHVHVPCGPRAIERYVSIEASDPRTAVKPLMIFPLYCKLAAPSSLAAEPKSNLVGVTERRLVAILNRERTSKNLPALHHDARVSAAALAYVKDRSAGLDSDPATILKRANLLAPAAAWTTLRVDSLESAIDRIVNSPEEVAKLSDPDRTDIGAAMQRVSDGWWVSIIYITIPKAIDPDQSAFLIRNRIFAASKRSSRDPYADTVAQRYAESLAIGWSNDPLRTRALAELGIHNGGGAQVIVDRRVEVEALDVPALISKYEFKYFGVGVAQSARDGALTGTIWIVVMFY